DVASRQVDAEKVGAVLTVGGDDDLAPAVVPARIGEVEVIAVSPVVRQLPHARAAHRVGMLTQFRSPPFSGVHPPPRPSISCAPPFGLSPIRPARNRQAAPHY